MLFKDIPIQRKLRTVILVTSGVVLFLTCSAFFAYEFFTFRHTTINQLTTLGEIIATNSTAALAFDSPEEASEILSALKAEENIVIASLYDKEGKLFSVYPTNTDKNLLPEKPDALKQGYQFTNTSLEGFQAVVQGNRQLGTLYLKSNLNAMYGRFKLYGIIAILVIVISSLIAYLLSILLQRSISKPILSLEETAKIISEHHDYSVRATKFGKDELGSLTDAFNIMLTQIQEQSHSLSEFNQKLEQKVNERTIELEVVNKELESFSYSVSHDLRAPLRSINGYTSILKEDYGHTLDEEGIKTMDIIINNAQKMGQLIDDLLNFSRVGKQNIIKINLNMNSIVESVVTDLKLEASGNNEIIMKPLMSAQGDSSMIKQVVTNLISNAFKYSGKKEKSIVEIGSYEDKGSAVYYVKDNGAGFDMLYYDKLFGVFQRLHSTNEFKGTGVGLAIVQRIILKHGGKVWAEGKVDEGATFYFSLPII